MTEILKKALMTGLGALAVTAEKASEVIDELVKKGELTFGQGKEMAKEYKDKFDSQVHGFDKKAEETVARVLSSMNIATKDDLKKLQDKLEEIERSINNR